MDRAYKEEAKARIRNFLAQVEKELCSELERRKSRFPSYNRLLNKFRNRRLTWETHGPKFINEITEITNEICIANIILSDSKSNCIKLEYEPKLDHGEQSIDFRALMDDGRTIYCDVKTIHPSSQDDWGKFVSVVEKGYLPENHRIILSETEEIKNDKGTLLAKVGLGGEIWHQWYNSRQSMLRYTMELENKIKNCNVTEKTFFIMVFCGNGHWWELDKLEDFADFYRTGCHRPDDPFSEMEAYFIEDKSIKLLRNINGFCYLERENLEIRPTRFKCNVRGPWF